MPTMELVEQHVIRPTDSRWAVIDRASWLAKNLWNYANYYQRQAFFSNKKILTYVELDRQLKTHPDYCALPRKVSQWILKQLDSAWATFFAGLKEYLHHPEKFEARPQIPKYKDKTRGRGLLVYTIQALSRSALRKGIIKPSGLEIEVKTRKSLKDIRQLRIVPHATHYTVELIYIQEVQNANLDNTLVAAIDIGLDNLAALTSNQPGFIPILINGRPLKSINQYCHKTVAHLQSQLPASSKTSQRLQRLMTKRDRRINAYLHSASRRVINTLAECRIGNLIIGKNPGWKQSINLGKRNNQNFVSIPHARFVQMLIYKARLIGIEVFLVEESYTSKCSFLDLEPLEHHESYLGQRVKRGLFVASNGRIINADVNAAYNIMRKAVPNAIEPYVHSNGIEAVVVQPIRVTPV